MDRFLYYFYLVIGSICLVSGFLFWDHAAFSVASFAMSSALFANADIIELKRKLL